MDRAAFTRLLRAPPRERGPWRHWYWLRALGLITELDIFTIRVGELAKRQHARNPAAMLSSFHGSCLAAFEAG